MITFQKCIPIIIGHEGGSTYTDDVDDPGGDTKYGISLLFLHKLSLVEGDIDHDGDIDADDIKAMSLSLAEDLYLNHFWDPLNMDGIKNDLLCLHLFDHGVNAGNGTAVKILQKLVGSDVDGKMGPNTIATTNRYCDLHSIVSDYASARKAYYSNLVALNPKLKKFLFGWYNRVNTTHF